MNSSIVDIIKCVIYCFFIIFNNCTRYNTHIMERSCKGKEKEFWTKCWRKNPRIIKINEGDETSYLNNSKDWSRYTVWETAKLPKLHNSVLSRYKLVTVYVIFSRYGFLLIMTWCILLLWIKEGSTYRE